MELPYYLRRQKASCSAWEHARLLCVQASILKAGAEAGRCIGGEWFATQALREVTALMGYKEHRVMRIVGRVKDGESRMVTNMKKWKEIECQTSGIKPLGWLFELWIRDQCKANVASEGGA